MKKGKFSTQVVTRELWKEFCKNHPEYADMKWDEFYDIWKKIAKKTREEVVNNPLGVKLPNYSGEIKLQFLPYKFKATDFTTSQELNKKVNHANISQRGKTATIKWERRWAVKFNKMLQYFAFEPNRDLNKLAKNRIDENANTIRISRNTLGGKSKWRSLIYDYKKGRN